MSFPIAGEQEFAGFMAGGAREFLVVCCKRKRIKRTGSGVTAEHSGPSPIWLLLTNFIFTNPKRSVTTAKHGEEIWSKS